MNTLQLEPGMTVAGRYALLSVLGSGGMAVVFEAHDQVIERRVALKILHKIEATARFEREARAASALHHPAVVKVFGIGTLPTGHPYIALEFIEGETLIDSINRLGRMPPERALSLLMPVVGAMAEAHAAGIVHRDIKPSNLIVQRAAGQFESLRLLDFGIALMDEGRQERLTQTGEIFGTPEFMAPEQAVGKPVGPPADVWALGAVLYELLAAEPPFSGAHAPGILYKVVNEPMPPLPDDVPLELAHLVGECLSKDPAHRPATATVLLSKMEGLLLRQVPALISSQGAAAVRPPRLLAHSTTSPAEVRPRASGALWIIAFALIAAVGAAGIWATKFRPNAPPVTTKAVQPHLTANALMAVRKAPVASSVSTIAPTSTPRAAPISTIATTAPASQAPASQALSSQAPASQAPASSARAPKKALAPKKTPASTARAPSLATAQGHIDAGEYREALSWLDAHPQIGGAIARSKIEALGRIGLNDMGRTSTILRRIIKQDASAIDGAFLGTVIRALGTQRYWRSLIGPLTHARVRSRVRPRLEAVVRTGSPQAQRRAKALLDAMSTPKAPPQGDYEAQQTRKLIAQLSQGGDCARRKRLIIALGKLGQASAIGPIQRERKAVGFSNLCMQGAIDDALKAIRSAQR